MRGTRLPVRPDGRQPCRPQFRRVLSPGFTSVVAGLTLCWVIGPAGLSFASAHRTAACVHQIVDQAGDANAPPGISSAANPLFPNVAAYDITYADIATSRTTFTGVIHVLKLATSTQLAPTGMEWRFDFTVGGTQLFVQAIVDNVAGSTILAAARGRVGYIDSSAHTLSNFVPVLDLARSEVRMTLPLSALAGAVRIKPGSRVSDLVASAGRFYNLGVMSISEADDHGWANDDYIAGAHSCVRA